MSTHRSPSGTRHSNNRSAWKRMRDTVFQRDGHRCVFVGSGGKRCKRRDLLAPHHIVLIADGGEPYDPDNAVTLCNPHHAYVHQHWARGYSFWRAEAMEEVA